MSTPTAQTEPLESWVHATAEIPAKGQAVIREADAAERADVARALNLNVLDTLQANYVITSVMGGGWRLKGRIRAEVEQSCIVSLEPVRSLVDEPFDVVFRAKLEEPEGGEDKSVLEGPDVEPLHRDTIAAGRIIFEALSGALDPYPRKEGVDFDWKDTSPGAENSNPFSVLVQLKGKK